MPFLGAMGKRKLGEPVLLRFLSPGVYSDRHPPSKTFIQHMSILKALRSAAAYDSCIFPPVLTTEPSPMHIHQHKSDRTLRNAVLGVINTLYNKYNSNTGKPSLHPAGNISAPSSRIRGTHNPGHPPSTMGHVHAQEDT